MACNGTVLPFTPIAVDYWKVRNRPSARVFFLSHMHADHTVGLTPSWSGGTIYCSAVSKKLLIHKFKIKPLYIQELELNEVHLVPLDSEGNETMSVSLFDANHCPGAVMFLFEGYFGRILYTGDFRYCPAMFLETPLNSCPGIDVLYLDNTYCSPKSVFPTRDEAKQEIIKIVQRSLPHDVVIGVRNLGKEDLLEELALKFKTRVIVSQEMYENLEILEAKDVFSTNVEDGFIFAVPFNKVNANFLQNFNPRNAERAVVMSNIDGQWTVVQNTCAIAVLPTSLYIGLDGIPHSNCPDIYIVPYSDHSSYTELCEFVKKVRPKSVIPIVAGNSKAIFHTSVKDRADMGCFRSYLAEEARVCYDIPHSVKQYMSTGPNSNHEDVLSGKRGKSKLVPCKPLCAKRSSTVKAIEYSDSCELNDSDRICDITITSTSSVNLHCPKEGITVDTQSLKGTQDGDIVECTKKLQDQKGTKCIMGTVNEENTNGPKDKLCLEGVVKIKTPVSTSSTQCEGTNVCTKNKRRKLPLTFEQCKRPKTIKSYFKSCQSTESCGESKKKEERESTASNLPGSKETDASLSTQGEEKEESLDLSSSSQSVFIENHQKTQPENTLAMNRTICPLLEISENSSDSNKSQVQNIQRKLTALNKRQSKSSDEVIVIDDSDPETEHGEQTEEFSVRAEKHSFQVDSVMGVIDQEVKHRLSVRSAENSSAQTRHKTKFCVKKRQRHLARHSKGKDGLLIPRV